jgi:hypothetical protein
MSKGSSQLAEKRAAFDNAGKDKNGSPKKHQLLDPRNERHLPAELRQRMIDRDLKVMRLNNLNDAKLSENRASRARRHKLDELSKNHLDESYGIKQMRPCGLCAMDFSEVNLQSRYVVSLACDLACILLASSATFGTLHPLPTSAHDSNQTTTTASR